MSAKQPICVSVVCPFFNEAPVLESSTRLMLDGLSQLRLECELILVNDGSTDESQAIAERLQLEDPRVRVTGYENNRGRGFALRTGVRLARGELVVTCEADSSWGADIVERLVRHLLEHPSVDMVVASPHHRGGGYRNVPKYRVLLSKVGNWVIRSALSTSVTMNTGMTRAYRREKLLVLPLDEAGKELHLEIVQKALALDFVISEIPAVLDWRDSSRRARSSNLPRVVNSHLLFSLMASPWRLLFAVSSLLVVGSAGLFAWSVYNLWTPDPSIYLLLLSGGAALMSFLVFAVGTLAHQNNSTLRELWRIRAASNERALRERDSQSIEADPPAD